MFYKFELLLSKTLFYIDCKLIYTAQNATSYLGVHSYSQNGRQDRCVSI